MVNEKGSFGPLKGIIGFLILIFLALFAWKVYPFLLTLLTLTTNSTVNIYITIGIIVCLLFTIVYLPFSIVFLDGKPNMLGALAVPLMFIVMSALVIGVYPVIEFMINLFGIANSDILLLIIFSNFVLLILLYGVPIGFYFYLNERMKW